MQILFATGQVVRVAGGVVRTIATLQDVAVDMDFTARRIRVQCRHWVGDIPKRTKVSLHLRGLMGPDPHGTFLQLQSARLEMPRRLSDPISFECRPDRRRQFGTIGCEYPPAKSQRRKRARDVA